MPPERDAAQWPLICPIDRIALHLAPVADAQPDAEDRPHRYRCPVCGFNSEIASVSGRAVPDFRALQTPQHITFTYHLPITPLDRKAVETCCFRAINQSFPHFSRREIRAQFGTKLDKGMQFYCQQLLRDHGPDVPVLDLGCGSGGNRRYLHALGFRRVLTADWFAPGADMLVDAHRLPFADGAFQMVISTAVFEHLYNPFVAMSEIARTLRPGGYFIGSASFWEAWHGSSYFHLTPDGWNALLAHAGLDLVDLWAGWGILPAALSHVLTPGHLRGAGYALQRLVEGLYRLFMGAGGVRRLQLRASGSYQLCARKPA